MVLIPLGWNLPLLTTKIRNGTYSSEEEPTADCQVTLGAGSLAMVGKEKMAAWQDCDKDLGWNQPLTAR
jgi:hypothetical protein